jgi:transcriptional regulator with XRE-family HTH domain
MTGKQLREIRSRMGLTQAQFGERIRMAGNSVARMERGGKDGMIITPPMALLISYVAREAGIDAPHEQTGRRAATNKTAHSDAVGVARRAHRRRQGRSKI